MVDKNKPFQQQQAHDYLFGVHDIEEPRNLDIRTDVPTQEMFQTLHYYQILKGLGSDAGDNLLTHYESLLISWRRLGRGEAVEVLKSREPAKMSVFSSTSEGVTEDSEKE